MAIGWIEPRAFAKRADDALMALRDARAVVAAGWAVQVRDGRLLAPKDYEAMVSLRLRHAVIMEGANVDCRAVRDGGG